MQSFYPECFERDMGCTEAEWLMWLPGAVGDHHWTLHPHTANVHIGEGRLELTWQTAQPRVVALMRIPRLEVRFRFVKLAEAPRYRFMKRFDLYMQRGGG